MRDEFKTVELTMTNFVEVKNDDGKVIDVKPVTESKEYILMFNINVIDEIDVKYKTYDKKGFNVFLEKLESKDVADIWKTSVDFLTMCVNEGIRQKNAFKKAAGLCEDDYILPEQLNIPAQNASILAMDVLGNGMPESKN